MLAARCLALSEEHGFGHWRNLSRTVRGICANQLDPSSDSLATVGSELAEVVGSVHQFAITALYALLSRAFLAQHQLIPAREIISKGLASAEQNSERMFEAEFLRQKARALVMEGGPCVSTDAQKLLEESLAVAQSQKARSLDCARPQTWRGSTATTAAMPKRATCSRRFMAGSPRVSTHKTSRKRRHYSMRLMRSPPTLPAHYSLSAATFRRRGSANYEGNIPLRLKDRAGAN